MSNKIDKAITIGIGLAMIVWGVAMLAGWLYSRWWPVVPMVLGLWMVWFAWRSDRLSTSGSDSVTE